MKAFSGIFLLSILFSSITYSQNRQTDSLDIYDSIIMERITVIGKPAWVDRTPGSASFIGYAQLQKQQYSDINRVLRRVSGVNIQEEDGFGLRPNIGLRGTGVERSSKITLMEDGVLIAPAPYAAPAAYYFPSIGRMNSVEVRKGSSQIKYGPYTTGGALNLLSTHIPYELQGMAEISVGEFNSRKIHATLGDTYKNFGFLVETYQMTNTGFKDLDFGGETGFDTKDFMAKFMFRTNADANIYQKVELKLAYYDEVSDETYLGLTDDDFDVAPYRRYAASQEDVMDADQTQLSVRHFAQFAKNLDLTTTFYNNEFNRNWYKLDKVGGIGISNLLTNPENYPDVYDVLIGGNSLDDILDVKANNREYYSRGIQSVLAFSFDAGKTSSEMELGLRYHEDGMDRFQWVDGYRMENGSMILTSTGIPGTNSNRIESAQALALYLQNKVTYNNWTFTPGLRFESINLKREDYGKADPERTGSDLAIRENDLNVFVPGLGVSYEVNEALHLFGGLHKGFAPPSPGSVNGTDAENSINYELGTRYRNEKLGIETVVFFNDYSNLLGSDLAAGGGAGTTEQFNAGEVNVIGAEFSFDYELMPENSTLKLPITLNYTFTEATFQNSFSSNYDAWGDVEVGDIIPYLPTHQFNTNLDAIYERADASLTIYGTSEMRTIAGQGSIAENESTDAYILVDLSFGYQINNNARIFTNIRNLTDQTYIVSRRPAGVRPGLPRMLMGGLKLDF